MYLNIIDWDFWIVVVYWIWISKGRKGEVWFRFFLFDGRSFKILVNCMMKCVDLDGDGERGERDYVDISFI